MGYATRIFSTRNEGTQTVNVDRQVDEYRRLLEQFKSLQHRTDLLEMEVSRLEREMIIARYTDVY